MPASSRNVRSSGICSFSRCSIPTFFRPGGLTEADGPKMPPVMLWAEAKDVVKSMAKIAITYLDKRGDSRPRLSWRACSPILSPALLRSFRKQLSRTAFGGQPRAAVPTLLRAELLCLPLTTYFPFFFAGFFGELLVSDLTAASRPVFTIDGGAVPA